MRARKVNQVTQYFLIYLRQAGLKQKTIQNYRYALKEFTGFLKDNSIEEVEDLSKNLVKEYLSLILNGKEKTRGIQTTAIHLRCLQQFFEYAMEQGYVLENLKKQIDIPKTGKHISKNYLTKKEVKKLFKTIDTSTLMGFTDYTFFLLLYGCGIRINEAASLETRDIDPEEGVIIIRHAKGDKDRIVPLPEMVVKQIKIYVNRIRKSLLERLGVQSTLVFFNYKGKKINRYWINYWLRFYALRANIDKEISCHCFRYSYATHMLEQGIDIRQLAELMGHTSLDSTAGYTKILVGSLIKEVNHYHPHGKLTEEEIRKEIVSL